MGMTIDGRVNCGNVHAMKLLTVVCFALVACSTPHYLPSRASWELYSIQGHATDHRCIGPDIVKHMPLYIYADDGTAFFLECQ